MMELWDNVMDGVTLDEDAEYNAIVEVMAWCDDTIFNPNEPETFHMMNCAHRVAHPRQLGDWMTICVDALTRQISCNCERCSRHGKCGWAALMEVIHFGVSAPEPVQTPDDGFGWKDHVRRARLVMTEQNVFVC